MNIQTKEIADKGKEIIQRASKIAKGKLEWILPFIFLALVLYSVYIWYAYAFNFAWDGAKKNEYIRMKQRDVVFEKEKFDAIISEIKERRNNYQKNLQGIPDIFQIK